jgi:hypothetical protein
MRDDGQHQTTTAAAIITCFPEIFLVCWTSCCWSAGDHMREGRDWKHTRVPLLQRQANKTDSKDQDQDHGR